MSIRRSCSMIVFTSIVLTSGHAYDTGRGYADVHVGIVNASMTLEHQSKAYKAPQYSLGLGVLGVWMEHLMLATSMDISYRGLDDALDEAFIFGFGTDIKMGYYLNGWSIYGLGNFQMQDYGTRTTYYGIGLGGGIEYRISKHLGVNLEYRRTMMYPADIYMDDYLYKTTGVNIKYIF